MPHGIGKSVRVAVFAQGDNAEKARAAGADIVGADDLAQQIKGGTMDFDVALATPDMMGVVGPLGRVLGPRGLMPSPRSGTVTTDITSAVREFKAGKIEFRNDKGGNVAVPVGKLGLLRRAAGRKHQRLLELSAVAQAGNRQGNLYSLDHGLGDHEPGHPDLGLTARYCRSEHYGDQSRSHEQICKRTDDGPASVGPGRQQSLLVLDLKDLDAVAEHGLRRDLRKKSIRLRVLKNSLARRVFSEMGMDGLSKYLKGPSAIAWGGEGITELAKEISAQVKTLKKPEIKGGAVEGVVVGPEQVDDITKLPSREVLIGQVIGLLLGPARQTLALLSSPSSTVVGQLEALVKRQEGAGGEESSPAAGSRLRPAVATWIVNFIDQMDNPPDPT